MKKEFLLLFFSVFIGCISYAFFLFDFLIISRILLIIFIPLIMISSYIFLDMMFPVNPGEGALHQKLLLLVFFTMILVPIIFSFLYGAVYHSLDPLICGKGCYIALDKNPVDFYLWIVSYFTVLLSVVLAFVRISFVRVGKYLPSWY
jgi:hypothetical protein